MRRLALFAASLLFALPAAPAGAATVTVSIRAEGFVPERVTIDTGDRITWVNRDTRNHQVVSDAGVFVSPILRPGQSYTFTFRASGTYRYRDALEPAERGTIVVRGPPPSVSLGATIPIVVFGTDTHLQGVVSNGRSGETVEVFAQPFGQESYAKVTEVLTTANGAFDYVLAPEILTNYQVQWKTATSQPVTVQVRPRLSLLPYGRRSFFARVTADRSFGGRWIYLQRRTQFGQWVSIAKLTLGPRSGRIFLKPRRAGVYRVFITINQAGSGYLESWSGIQRIREARR
jgi:plastocyanin